MLLIDNLLGYNIHYGYSILPMKSNLQKLSRLNVQLCYCWHNAKHLVLLEILKIIRN